MDTPILTVIAGGANADLCHSSQCPGSGNEVAHFQRALSEEADSRSWTGSIEMGKMFRNEGMDKNHNPEFTSMECYMAYGNMESVMDVTEQVVSRRLSRRQVP